MKLYNRERRLLAEGGPRQALTVGQAAAAAAALAAELDVEDDNSESLMAMCLQLLFDSDPKVK